MYHFCQNWRWPLQLLLQWSLSRCDLLVFFLGFANTKELAKLVWKCEIFSALLRESIRKISKMAFIFLSLSEKKWYVPVFNLPEAEVNLKLQRCFRYVSSLNSVLTVSYFPRSPKIHHTYTKGTFNFNRQIYWLDLPGFLAVKLLYQLNWPVILTIRKN